MTGETGKIISWQSLMFCCGLTGNYDLTQKTGTIFCFHPENTPKPTKIEKLSQCSPRTCPLVDIVEDSSSMTLIRVRLKDPSKFKDEYSVPFGYTDSTKYARLPESRVVLCSRRDGDHTLPRDWSSEQT